MKMQIGFAALFAQPHIIVTLGEILVIILQNHLS
jgi:hypothetical protein